MAFPYLNGEARIPCITHSVYPPPQLLARAEPHTLHTGKRGELQDIGLEAGIDTVDRKGSSPFHPSRPLWWKRSLPAMLYR